MIQSTGPRSMTMVTLSFFLVGFSSAFAEGIHLQGRLLEKGTRKPLGEVPVYVLPHKLKAITNARGEFHFYDVPEGAFEWVVNQTGYLKYTEADSQAPQETNERRDLYLERLSYNAFETTVVGKEDRREDFKRVLSAKKAVSLPGSGNDALRAVQNLPGVARVPGLASTVVIQGSAPGDTRYLIDSHEVPIIFHFGGFSSVLQPEALDRIDYLSAGYGPDYSRALGGQIGAWTKNPETETTRGFAFVDLLNAGGAIETPLDDKSSLYVGGRKSYIGNVMRAVVDDQDFDLTAAPSFDDVSLIYRRELTERDEFKLVAIGSRDQLQFLVKETANNDPLLRGDFYNQTAFFRLIPQWSHRHSNGATTRVSAGLGRDFIQFRLGEEKFWLRTIGVTARAEHERPIGAQWRLVTGMDHSLAWADVRLNARDFYSEGGVSNPVSSTDRQELSLHSRSGHTLGFYTQALYTGVPSWTMRGGLRADYFGATQEFHAAPRIGFKKELSESTSLRLATGLYYQPPKPQETSSGIGNPDLKSPRALHVALAGEKDFRGGSNRGWVLTSGPFYKQSKNLVVPSTQFVNRDGVVQSENYSNQGKGKAVGMEVFLRGDFAPYSAWVSYTLSRSTRRQNGQSEYVSQFDQTHNLTLIGAMDLTENWKVSTRFRYVSGNPYTPVTSGVFDSDNDTFIPIRGPFYSERQNPFWQLDLRFDKRWVFRNWILTAYFDVQNVLNHRNVEAINYAYDYKSRQDVKGLPILPILGVKGEF
ncbi:MAG: hypothetical protein EOP09_01720 [Proteobacteria bacterium]|nr:MAG: hypothetical protein EOP09_01720 [Pseudomonadota bacterium]